MQSIVEKMRYGKQTKILPERVRVSHKGDFGRVLVIGGDYGMGGAVRLAAEATARIGAGLVAVATRAEHVMMLNCVRPEIMAHGIKNARGLNELLQWATVIIIGPGLGQSFWSKSLLAKVLREKEKPLVVDADALNLLAKKPRYKNNWVLTPHPGEAARLLQVNISAIQEDRVNAVIAIQKKYGGVCVLKGAGTLVATASAIKKCEAGNPGMASGGMGDVLSGVIGGLSAQSLSLEDAATYGVWLHAKAGDDAAKQGGERGMLALDLLPFLRKLVN